VTADALQLAPEVRAFCEGAAAEVARAEREGGLAAAAAWISEHAVDRASFPDAALEPAEETYARHRLHRCPETGVVVYLMVWRSGQASPVHDHGGACGVVQCLGGELEVTGWELDESDRDPARAALREGPTVHLDACSPAATCGPGQEIHQVRNVGTGLAFSLHTYSREITDYFVFDPERQTRERRSMGSAR